MFYRFFKAAIKVLGRLVLIAFSLKILTQHPFFNEICCIIIKLLLAFEIFYDKMPICRWVR